MRPKPSFTSALALVTLVVVSATFLRDRPGVAAERTTGHTVTAGAFCEASVGDCLLAAAATIGPRGMVSGAFVLEFPALARRLVLSPQQGRVEAGDTGPRAVVHGLARLDAVPGAAGGPGNKPAHPDFVWLPLSHATLALDSSGAFVLMLGDRTIVGSTGVGGVQIRESPAAAAGESSTHEVGHWLGLLHTFDTSEPPLLVFGMVTARGDVEGLPEIAGLFRDTAEGETGHMHGHLDFLKQVSDPGTGRPGSQSGFAASGSATCVYATTAERRTDIELTLDAIGGILRIEGPACGFAEVLPVERVSCSSCGNTVIVGPPPIR